MSDKIVVCARRDGNTVVVTTPDGDTRRQPLTERVEKKLDGLPKAYFYAKEGPEGLNLTRLAPFKAWEDAT